MSQSQKARFKTLIGTVLDPVNPAHTLRPEILELAELMSLGSGFEHESHDDISTGETRGDHGVALSPTMAAMCAADYYRTVIFLRGVHAAAGTVLSCQDRDAAAPVRVLYAGCGPLGMLCVPLMAELPERVRFTMIDIHEDSVRSVERLITSLGVESRVDQIVRADATTYRVDPECLPDLVVTETMQVCLEKEPQVAISRSLMSQAPQAVLVPESIRLDAVLIDPGKEFDLEGDMDLESKRVRVPMGRVFEINKDAIRAWAELEGDSLPGRSIEIPDPFPAGLSPMLFTTVRVFGEHVLEAYQSGITIPRPLPIEGAIAGGDRFVSRYRLGNHPRIEFDRDSGAS